MRMANQLLSSLLSEYQHKMSNGWTSYADIPQILCGIYIHDVIVHQRNFVDPNDPTVHTQFIENTWMRAKRKSHRHHGTSGPLFQSYIAEFLWRQRTGEISMAK